MICNLQYNESFISYLSLQRHLNRKTSYVWYESMKQLETKNVYRFFFSKLYMQKNLLLSFHKIMS